MQYKYNTFFQNIFSKCLINCHHIFTQLQLKLQYFHFSAHLITTRCVPRTSQSINTSSTYPFRTAIISSSRLQLTITILCPPYQTFSSMRWRQPPLHCIYSHFPTTGRTISALHLSLHLLGDFEIEPSSVQMPEIYTKSTCRTSIHQVSSHLLPLHHPFVIQTLGHHRCFNSSQEVSEAILTHRDTK